MVVELYCGLTAKEVAEQNRVKVEVGDRVADAKSGEDGRHKETMTMEVWMACAEDADNGTRQC